jgi:hypothetical protein
MRALSPEDWIANGGEAGRKVATVGILERHPNVTVVSGEVVLRETPKGPVKVSITLTER